LLIYNLHNFPNLLSHLKASEFTDPIIVDTIIPGEIYGFIIEHDNLYLAASLKQFNNMIPFAFRGYNLLNVFVPIKNSLIPIESIRWVQF
jgi:hypothetical protein